MSFYAFYFSVRKISFIFVCVCVSPAACFVDSELPLDSIGAELLADVFDVLSLKELKLTAMSGPSPSDDPPEDEMAVAKAVLQKKLVSQVYNPLTHTRVRTSNTPQ